MELVPAETISHFDTCTDEHCVSTHKLMAEILGVVQTLDLKVSATLGTVDTVMQEIAPTIEALSSGPVGKMLGLKSNKVPEQRKGGFFG